MKMYMQFKLVETKMALKSFVAGAEKRLLNICYDILFTAMVESNSRISPLIEGAISKYIVSLQMK
jgi:hypothetical protein